MKVTRGLIIAEPWIGHILEGRKDWEMRSQATAHRGWFGLIRKGSGQVVGLARLVECGKALNPADMMASHDHHCIPDAMIRAGEVAKWVIPWKLADIRPLERPISYEHKSGAVTWVLFSDQVSARLAEVLEGTAPTADVAVKTPSRMVEASLLTRLSDCSPQGTRNTQRPPSRPTPSLPEQPQQHLGQTLITAGNLRNNHFYIGEFLDKFPDDSIGGRNNQEAAPREVIVDWGGPFQVRTDIDRTKRMFRRRGWVRQFFEASGAREGDTVVITSSAPYQVNVRIVRTSMP